MNSTLISPLSIAPMIAWTNTHFRVLMRLIAPKALLYTEMQTLGAVKNKPEHALFYTVCETPLALQLGGAEKEDLIWAAKLAAEKNFVEINLNLGCPSEKVQAGRFGACLMKEGAHVAACIAAMKKVTSIPITAKTRIGIDHEDSYAFFAQFAHQLKDAGCDKLIVHARKAWLKGLNPKQNRTIPPLHYDFVYEIKKELPKMPVVINGNIKTIDEVTHHMRHVDGVMLGRLACDNPYALALIHHHFYPKHPIPTRFEIMQNYLSYIIDQHSKGVSLSLLLKPLFNLAHGMTHAKQWKNKLLLAQQIKDVSPLMDLLLFLEENEMAQGGCGLRV